SFKQANPLARRHLINQGLLRGDSLVAKAASAHPVSRSEHVRERQFPSTALVLRTRAASPYRAQSHDPDRRAYGRGGDCKVAAHARPAGEATGTSLRRRTPPPPRYSRAPATRRPYAAGHRRPPRRDRIRGTSRAAGARELEAAPTPLE